MASIKLQRAIMEIIDPETASLAKLKKEEREELHEKELRDLENLEDDALDIIELVEEHQASTLRLLVVGQIQYADQEQVYTVALGPFGARGKLDTPEKFRSAAEASTAAHEKGGRLAWDVKTGQGRGRYMVVPLLRTPRDAWDFWRSGNPDSADELVENIEASIRGPEMDEIFPACSCGMRPPRKCHRHNAEK